MSEHFDMHYLRREEINPAKWDDCIDRSLNAMIYARVDYLDRIAEHWDALVVNDYEYVMPLVWNRKWGFVYLYQPPLTQQLGIFSARSISEELIGQSVAFVKQHYPFAEIFLNFSNYHPSFQARHNYILRLNSTYENIRSGYKEDLEKNLRRAAKYQLNYIPFTDLTQALAMHQQVVGHKTPHMTKLDFERFKNACDDLLKKREVLVRAATNQKDELLSIALLLFAKNRLCLVESTTFEMGRKTQANHFLLDRIIEEYSGRPLTLDFVGSDIAGIAHFYKNFGAVSEPYYFLRYNHLPWLLRWLKKDK
jgi:hypothetical protein